MNTNLNKSKIKNPAKKNILPFKLPNYMNLKTFFDKVNASKNQINILSMGMSGDYEIAIREGSTMIRLGSSIFGKRAYLK